MNHPQLQALTEIRDLMQRSSRFISLSGLSGVGAGIFALIGAGISYIYLGKVPFDRQLISYELAIQNERWGINYITFFILLGFSIFLGAVLSAIFFTTRKARRKGLPIWDRLSKRLLLNLFIPIGAGGIFCLALFKYQLPGLIAPSTLIFYGLGLVNASKYTLVDIKYLGLSEIILGSIALFYIGFGLEFWAIGFGVLHVVYGILMYLKYEKKGIEA